MSNPLSFYCRAWGFIDDVNKIVLEARVSVCWMDGTLMRILRSKTLSEITPSKKSWNSFSTSDDTIFLVNPRDSDRITPLIEESVMDFAEEDRG